MWATHLAGCSAGVGRSCEVDSDCAESQICAEGRCERTCTTDEDCVRPDYTCQSWVDPDRDEPVNVCLMSGDAGPGDDGGLECTTDRECQMRYDAGEARCGIDGRCIIAEQIRGLMIRDRTEVSEMGPEARRGAEVGAIFVTGDSPEDRRHARTVMGGYRPESGLDGTSHIDGREVALDETNECVTPPLADHTTPLGGGDLVVEFPAPSDDTASIAPGDEVAIVEWAADNCGDSDGDVDEYDVYLCVTETGPLGPNDCDERIAEGATGYTTVTPRPESR